ncbi:MAG TPA: MamK family actin-like protein [Candidatus Binatia bacterium]|nr:MamK family actin-like protein [Candidatus Binatia bacterium]
MEQQDATPKKNSLYIGIDLGTSSSAIVDSNRKKHWVESYVGWPKDFIAAKVLRKPVLFGSEALKNRLSLDIFRPLEHGVLKEGNSKERESVKELIHHLISLAKPEKDMPIYAVVGVPAESFKVNKKAIISAVADYVTSVIVVSEPFAVAYAMDLLNNAMIIDIGAGTIDFCIMHGTLPTEDDQRTILSAGDYIDNQLFKLLNEKFPASTFNLNMVRMFKEQNSFVGTAKGQVKVEIPVAGKLVEHEISDEIRRACESILPPMVETISEMIAKFDPEYQSLIRGNIVLAGGGSQIRGLGDALKTAMKDFGPIQVRTVDDPMFAGAAGAMKLAQEMPQQYWEKLNV